MKKTILLVLVLGLSLAVEVANADFTFGEPVNLGPPINSPSREVAFTLSADGLEMYISSERSGGLGYIDMWRSTRENADSPWGPLVNVQEINSRYNEAFPSLSADGLTLYFSDWFYTSPAGNRPGGVGGHDLWMCTRASRNDTWGTPVNVGAPVNSGSEEVSPTISHDGLTFIFASKRSGGRGDYDLWMSTRPAAESDWAAPVNMGQAVNSSAYDAEPCLSTDGLVLFFCSNRSGGMGSYDVWMTTRPSQAAAWDPPVNLGPPINTSGGMEGMPCLSADSKTLYFGTGSWDFWQVPIEPICDLNNDLKIDSTDMHIMVDHWGENYALCDIGPTPLGDGVVDIQDFIVLTEHLYRLTAHWKLDETEGSIAYDSVGDYDGTINGNPLWLPVGGMKDGSLMLDGIDDYIDTPFILDPAKEAFSVTAWVSCWTPGQVIISQSNTTGTRGPILGSTWLGIDPSGKLMTGFSDIHFGALVSETVITDIKWHHVGFVYDTDTFHRRLYVDGVLVAEDTSVVSGVPSDGGLYIGASKDLDATSFFSGMIDDIRIYNQTLTSEEIAAMAQ